MGDNVLKFPGNRNAMMVKPHERVAHFPIHTRAGKVDAFTVPIRDMYWWVAIYEKIAEKNPYFENVFYFYSEPYGWHNNSYAKRRTSCEVSIDRNTLEGILRVVSYTHIMSLGGELNDDDYQLVHDNASMVLGDDLEIDYTMGVFIAPTSDPDRFILNFVEC